MPKRVLQFPFNKNRIVAKNEKQTHMGAFIISNEG